MPTSTTVPRGRTMASDCSIDSALPTQSNDDVGAARQRRRHRRRAAVGQRARVAAHGARAADRAAAPRWRRARGPAAAGAGSARPTSTADGAGHRPLVARCETAAVTSSPSVPAPSTATTSPSAIGAPSTACTAQATGSTITAASSLSASGTAWSWLAWATSPDVDQPPPVSAQNPVCSPGRRWPKARRPQFPTCPAGTRRTAGRCRGRRSRARAPARPGCPPPTRHPRRRPRPRRRRPPPRGRARTGTRRWARSSASCGRRWWPGRTRRCPRAGGRRAPSPIAGSGGRLALDQSQRPDAGAAPRPEGRHDARRGEPRQRALEQQRAHEGLTAP